MRERVSFFSRADRSPTSVGVSRCARVLPVVVTLFLAAPGVAAADDGLVPLVPIDTAAAVSPTTVVESVPAAPAPETVAEVVETVAAVAPAPVAPAAPAEEAIPAAIAPDEPAAAAVEAPVDTSSAAPSEPMPSSNTAPPEQYQAADERYHGTTASADDEQPAPDAAPTSPSPASQDADTTSASETPQPQFVWNWVWHCAPAIDMTSVPLPQNLPDNAIINWVWDSSCSSGDSAPIPDQYQETGAQYHQQNTVISIRVNSPGDDGPIVQMNVGGTSAPVVVITPPAVNPAEPMIPRTPSVPFPMPSVPLPLLAVPIPLPLAPSPIPVVVPVVPAFEDISIPVVGAIEPVVAITLGPIEPEAAQQQAPSTRNRAAAPPATGGPSFAQPAVWVAAPATLSVAPVSAARATDATRARSRPSASAPRIPSGPLPLDLSTHAAGSAGGGAGGSSGLLLSALAALLAAYLLWPPQQWAGVVSVSGGMRKRVVGGRLERPG